MGVTTFNDERESPVSAGRMFKALISEAHECLPKILPQLVKAIEVDGNIQKTVFTEGSSLKYLKYKIDSMNSENFTCKYTLIEGDILGKDKNIESISYLMKFEPSGNGGCVIKTQSEYHTKGDTKVKEEHTKADKENTSVLSKMVEEYLLKNPTVYA